MSSALGELSKRSAAAGWGPGGVFQVEGGRNIGIDKRSGAGRGGGGMKKELTAKEQEAKDRREKAIAKAPKVKAVGNHLTTPKEATYDEILRGYATSVQAAATQLSKPDAEKSPTFAEDLAKMKAHLAKLAGYKSYTIPKELWEKVLANEAEYEAYRRKNSVVARPKGGFSTHRAGTGDDAEGGQWYVEAYPGAPSKVRAGYKEVEHKNRPGVVPDTIIVNEETGEVVWSRYNNLHLSPDLPKAYLKNPPKGGRLWTH